MIRSFLYAISLFCLIVLVFFRTDAVRGGDDQPKNNSDAPAVVSDTDAKAALALALAVQNLKPTVQVCDGVCDCGCQEGLGCTCGAHRGKKTVTTLPTTLNVQHGYQNYQYAQPVTYQPIYRPLTFSNPYFRGSQAAFNTNTMYRGGFSSCGPGG